MWAGMDIWRSNLTANVFGQDLSADDEAKYQGNFTATRGVAWQTDACAVVEKMAISNEMFRDVSRQDNLFVSKMLSGGGSRRAEACGEVSVASTQCHTGVTHGDTRTPAVIAATVVRCSGIGGPGRVLDLLMNPTEPKPQHFGAIA